MSEPVFLTLDQVKALHRHVAEAQAFMDGNKRTGIAAALVFLEGNSVSLPAATDELHAAMIAIAERRMDKAGLASLSRRLSA